MPKKYKKIFKKKHNAQKISIKARLTKLRRKFRQKGNTKNMQKNENEIFRKYAKNMEKRDQRKCVENCEKKNKIKCAKKRR